MWWCCRSLVRLLFLYGFVSFLFFRFGLVGPIFCLFYAAPLGLPIGTYCAECCLFFARTRRKYGDKCDIFFYCLIIPKRVCYVPSTRRADTFSVRIGLTRIFFVVPSGLPIISLNRHESVPNVILLLHSWNNQDLAPINCAECKQTKLPSLPQSSRPPDFIYSRRVVRAHPLADDVFTINEIRKMPKVNTDTNSKPALSYLIHPFVCQKSF